MKLNENELKVVIEVLQEEHDEELLKDDKDFNVNRSLFISDAIFKLRHQLKHLEDKK